MENINHRMALGALWMVLFRLIERSIGLISTIILARLLVPADFGLVAMATAIIAVIELIGAFNFDAALIQNQHANRQHFDTVWTLNILLACFYALMLCLLARPASTFYGEPRLEAIMYCLSIGQFILGFENIGIVAFRKELKFQKEFRLLFGKKLIGFCVTVYLAYTMRNYWALVAGILAGRISSVIITYVLHPYRPRFSIAKTGELFQFSKWLLINNVLFFFTNKFTDFVIGKIIGMHALGVYSIAYELSNLPSTELVNPINRAILPGYSRISGDVEKLKRSFLEVTGVISVISIPVGVGLVVVAEPLVLTILGEKWVEVIPLFQLLAFNGTLNAIGTNLGPMCIALGKPRIMTTVALIFVSILIPCLIIGAKLGDTLGAVIGMVAAHIIVFPIGWWMVLSRIDIKVRHLWLEIWRPLVASVCMGFFVEYVLAIIRPGALEARLSFISLEIGAVHMPAIIFSPIIQLAIAVLAGVVAFLISLFLLCWSVSFPNGAEVRIVSFLSGWRNQNI